MKSVGLALLSALALSGCLGVQSTDDLADDGGATANGPVRTGPKILTGADVRSEQVAPGVSASRREVAAWELTYEPALLDLEATLTWLNGTNRFTLEVRTPSGTESFPAGSDVNDRQTVADVEDLAGGTYRFAVVTTGVITPDKVTLEVAYKRVVDLPIDQVQGELPVETYEENGHWLATIAYSATGSVGETATADVEGTNGFVSIGQASGAAAVLDMVAWARADSEQAAIDMVRAVDVRLRIADDLIEGAAAAGSWNHRGVHVGVYVPQGTTLGGTISGSNGGVEASDLAVEGLTITTSNGGMEFQGVHGRDLVGHTSNGALEGEVQVAGTLELETSNGGVDLTVRPADDLDLTIDTSNGEIDLRLEERSDVAYNLDLDTSNGRIDVDMDEADYEGDRNDGTVTTRNGSGRAVQVAGGVGTSNGAIRLESA